MISLGKRVLDATNMDIDHLGGEGEGVKRLKGLTIIAEEAGDSQPCRNL